MPSYRFLAFAAKALTIPIWGVEKWIMELLFCPRRKGAHYPNLGLQKRKVELFLSVVAKRHLELLGKIRSRA